MSGLDDAKLDVKKMSLADASTGHAFMIIDTEEGDTPVSAFIQIIKESESFIR